MTPVLVDSAVWIDHIRRPELALVKMMRDRRVRIHPFVLGEIALGSIASRAATLASIAQLRMARVARPLEILELIERERLYGRGIGYVDVHLLASTLLTPGAALWTRDKRLRAAAEQMGIAAADV